MKLLTKKSFYKKNMFRKIYVATYLNQVQYYANIIQVPSIF